MTNASTVVEGYDEAERPQASGVLASAHIRPFST